MKIKAWVDETDPGSTMIPFSGVCETNLLAMDDAEREAWCKENGATR